LQFVGDFLDYHGLYTIVATLRSPLLTKSVPIRFIVDTGARHTIISIPDAQKMGIEYNELQISSIPIKGIGGESEAYILRECKLLFTDIATDKMYPEDLGYALTLSPFIEDEKKKAIIMSIPSLLGIDILQKYSIQFSSMSVILEP
jgi:aspartyl protease